MIKLYSASDPIQAHVLRGALEAAGIAADVRGGYLFSTRGESPITIDTLPTVWIADDADLAAAEEIVRRFEAAPPPGPLNLWRCPGCSELSEPQFDQCWNCGAARPQ
jgi:hypothetical protein